MIDNPPRAYDIPAFCHHYKVSRAKLYMMWDMGCGPRRVRIGRRVYILHEDAEAWYLGHREVVA